VSWFLKGNARRYYRMDLPIQCFLLPRNNKSFGEVYSNGIDYLNTAAENEISLLKRKVLNDLDSIREHKDIIAHVVNEVLERTDMLCTLVTDINQGASPKAKTSYWLNKAQLQSRFATFSKIKQSSPKTHVYLMQLEEKYLSRISSILETTEKSDANSLHAEHLQFGFAIDSTLEHFRKPVFQKIPLLRLILGLGTLLEYIYFIYEEISRDHLVINSPEYWKTQEINISACGMSMKNIRLFELFQSVDIQIYIPAIDEKLRFEGRVVKSVYDKKTNTNLSAFSFIFPSGKEQYGLQSYIQLFEATNAMEKFNGRN
jgi:predicted nucleic acid-binding protein